jgi:S-adenosylmethionine hydrolase
VFTSYKFFPAGTVHVVVVDPGVGSERRILCVSAVNHLFLAPDNGVLKYVFQESADARVFQVTARKYVLPQISQTFHGRDIFAPVAAYLAKGLDPGEVGPPVSDFNKGRLPKLEKSQHGINGEIIYVDRFGNLISNIPVSKLNGKDPQALKIQVKNYRIQGWANSYAAGERNKPIAVIGSSGFLEIAVFMGNAQTVLGCELGDEVAIEF